MKYSYFPLKKLAHRLRTPETRDSRQTLKDRMLAQRLSRTFERDLELAGVHGIHFYARSGIVTLYGTIRHELDRELIGSFVRQIPGVKGIVEHLQVVEEPFQDAEPALTLKL